jgi:transposase
MMRMLIVGYCYGIRTERRLCQEVELHLAYRWFCKLDLDDKVPHHSTFSENRLGRFRESDLLRHIFERPRRRGRSGARDEFHLAAIVQNLKPLALRLIRPPPQPARA